jgi:hypothetical protein
VYVLFSCDFPTVYVCGMGRDSSVCIATRYGLDGLWIESRWGGGKFSVSVQNGAWAHPGSYTMGDESFPGVKRPERGFDHPPHLAPTLKKEYSYTSTSPLDFRCQF